MKIEEIKVDHTYMTELNTRWTVKSISGNRMTATDGKSTVRDHLDSFAPYCVRDATPVSDRTEEASKCSAS